MLRRMRRYAVSKGDEDLGQVTFTDDELNLEGITDESTRTLVRRRFREMLSTGGSNVNRATLLEPTLAALSRKDGLTFKDLDGD
jgi:hypothetical protein